jgi:Uma2 family endonuclease
VIEQLGNLRRDDFSAAELDGLPRDGRRYEVVDGRLLVTGAQAPIHQAAVIGLMVRLKQACPPDQLVAFGSLDFRPDRRLSLRPDLLVCRREDAGPKYADRLLLAVEVISPSTRTTDVVLKRGLYEQHAVPSYWLLDPDRQELTILELTDDRYICQTVIQGDEPFEVTRPFPHRLTAAEVAS